MKAAIVPILLSLVGLGVGGGVGFVLHTPEAPDPELVAQALEQKEPDEDTASDFVKLNNQFVVPVVKGGRVAALVVTSLQLQVATVQRTPYTRLNPGFAMFSCKFFLITPMQVDSMETLLKLVNERS